MKKILFLSAFFFPAFIYAQTGSSYLMLNFNLRKANEYNRRFGHPYGFYGNRQAPFPIGLQYIKQNRPNSALRFGFTLHEQELYGKYNSYSIGDTFYTKQNIYEALLPKVTFGKEWQKRIHKDVALYGGADLGFGIMKSPEMLYENKNYQSAPNAYYSTYSGRQTGSNIIVNASVRPFMGLRTDWNRFSISYEASLPVNYTKVLNEEVHSIPKPTIQHQISVGYKFYNRKK